MSGLTRLEPFHIEHWYERYEFTTELMLSSSDCESRPLGELLDLEVDARERFDRLWLGYTETPGAVELREAVAAQSTECTADDVVVLAAAEEAIFVALHALLEPGDHAIVESPCYQSALTLARSTGAEVDEWRRAADAGWTHDLGQFEALLQPRTRLVYVNSPHNPTGAQLSSEQFATLARLCAERGITLFSDEVYRGLEHDPATRLPLAADLTETALSLGAPSKALGLPGLRLGWLICRDAATRRRLLDLKLYTTICSSAPSEFLAALALRQVDTLLRRNLALVRDNLGLVEATLAETGDRLSWTAPTAGPIGFARVQGCVDTQQFCTRLAAEESVLLLPGEVYGLPGYVRIGFGRTRLPEALERLGRFLARQ